MTYVGKKPADIIATAVDTTTGTFSGDLTVDTNTLFVDSANNRVGVGTVSPNANTKLDVNGAARIGNSTDGIMIENNTGSFDIDNASYIRRDSSSGALEITSGSTTARNMIFNTKTNGAESARIDSSGNLLVGKTSATASDVGVQVQPIGRVYATRDGDVPLVLRRNTSDGNIAQFLKDGTTVGSIGAEGGQIYIVNGDTGLKFAPSVDGIIPVNAGGANRDNAIDLGVGSVRFKDLYLSNAAYTTYVKGGSGHTGQMHFTGSHDIRFVNNGNERMRIDAGGSVLIGKSTPTDLHNTWNHLIIGEKGAIISENGGGGIDGISISDNAYIDSDTGAYAYQTTDEASIISQTGGNIIFSNAASGSAGAALSFSERMRIASSGYIYVNTGGAEPSASQVGVRITGEQGASFWNSANSGTGGYNHLNFYNGNGLVGQIYTNASGTVYGTSSDYRLKENVTTSWDATTRLKQLKPSRFNFIADGTDSVVDGFLAHEVASIVPEAITGEKDAVDSDGNIVPQSIDQSKLVPLLVKTIQELEARITALEGA